MFRKSGVFRKIHINTVYSQIFNLHKILKGEVRSIFIFWYFILYNIKILSTYFCHLNYSALPKNGMQRNSRNAQLNVTTED